MEAIPPQAQAHLQTAQSPPTIQSLQKSFRFSPARVQINLTANVDAKRKINFAPRQRHGLHRYKL